MGTLVALLIAVILLVQQTALTVSEPEQAIVVQFGNPQRTIQEPGLYFKLPFVQNVIPLEKRVLSTDARTAEYLRTIFSIWCGRSVRRLWRR